MRLDISFLRPYFGIISLLIITAVASTYIFSRTNLEIYSFILSIISVLMIMGFFGVFVPYSFSFYLCLFSSAVFPAFNLSVWSAQRVPSHGFVSIVAILLVGVIPILAHRYVYKIDLTTPTVYEGTMIMFLFYLFGAVLFSSIPQLAPQTTIDFIFWMGICMFIIVSVQITNIAFRVKILNDRLKIKNRIKKVEMYENALEKKSQYDENDIDLILFYLKISLEDFIAGDFEGSFESAFKILFDEYQGQYVFKDIHQIQNYEDRRKKYAKIRNSLVHAKARSARIQKTEDLKKVRKGLFENALDLLKIVKFEYMDVITS